MMTMTQKPQMNPTRIEIQTADVELIRLLAEHLVLLTRSQICELYPTRSVRRTNFRLRQLFKAGYLSRRYPSGMLMPKIPLYYPGPKAAEALNRQRDDHQVLASRKRALLLRDGAIPHTLLVNAVHIKFLTASLQYKDFELLSWISQHDPLWNTLNRYGFPLRPDGYGEFRKEPVIIRFFLELDRSAQRGRALHAKLAGYAQYARSGRFQQHFSASGFRVLFVPQNPRRARQLLRAMSKFASDLFWVAPADAFLQKPLFDPCWHTPSSDTLSALDLPF